MIREVSSSDVYWQQCEHAAIIRYFLDTVTTWATPTLCLAQRRLLCCRTQRGTGTFSMQGEQKTFQLPLSQYLCLLHLHPCKHTMDGEPWDCALKCFIDYVALLVAETKQQREYQTCLPANECDITPSRLRVLLFLPQTNTASLGFCSHLSVFSHWRLIYKMHGWYGNCSLDRAAFLRRGSSLDEWMYHLYDFTPREECKGAQVSSQNAARGA